ncbi:MFS transporter [Convivina praedatoris]|uniref:Transport protein HsrA n=1 Tax=Convivina praedatoris TaxID=2880963 RepID=A0ABN8H775_9LACO|nr:MFS transporter [Convivina sp. LMG 32447]CAH1850437.1 putative transport protein HsrA [Convivina sp. LMG 32447]CAH1850754.1 putative transport protein HsrA [Convivina sp. LMG 32447]CAH1850770.1 putative transport protein HsrA [Convivina sp. LMG 32447]
MFKSLRQLTLFSLVLLFIAFVMSISQSTMTTAYPILMHSFNVSASTVQWLTTGFMVTMTLVMPLSPWLLDNIPLRYLLNGIVIVFLIGTAWAIVTPNFTGIIIGRLLEGIAVGALFPTFQSVILESTPKDRRGPSMGVVGLVMGSALAVGPIVSGIILQWGSWRQLFGFFFIVLIVLVLLIQKQIKNVHTLKPYRFDWLSAVMLLGFGGILYSISVIPTQGINAQWWLMMVISTIILGIFVARQLKLTTPFLNLSVFHYHGYLPAMILTGLSYSGLITATVLMPLFYQKVFHFNPLASGLLMVPAAIFLSLLNPKAGYLLQKIGLKRLVRIGTSMMVLGYGLLALMGQANFWVGLVAAMLLEGGNAFIMMPAVTAANNALPEDLVAHGTAILTTLRQVIGAGSVVVASILITSFNQNVSYGTALSQTSAWFIFVPVLGLLLSTQIKTEK